MANQLLQTLPYNSILCLNGELPPRVMMNTLRSVPIIAADGALNHLTSLGVIPQMVIGDLDSCDPVLLEHYTYKHIPCQDTCDYEKCLRYLGENGLLPTLVLGMGGGYLDHVLNNLNLFINTGSYFYHRGQIGLTLQGGGQITLPHSQSLGTKISLFGIPTAQVTTKGLKWDLTRSELSFPGTNSTFNRVISGEVVIECIKGHLLTIIYDHDVRDSGAN